MAINLGLEALVPATPHSEPTLSYEYLDAVIEYAAASDELTMVFDQFEDILVAVENLAAIHESIVDNGVTPALEALIGGNFANGLSLEAVEASMEAADNASAGFWAKLWAAIKQFFIKLFATTKGMNNRVGDFLTAAKAADAEVTCMPFKGIKPELLARVGELLDSCKNGFVGNKQIKDVQTLGDPIAEVELADKDAAIAYAAGLVKLLTNIESNKAVILKNCDIAVDEVQKKLQENASKEEQAAAKEEAKAAKEMVNKIFKSVMSSAAAFLSHTKVGKKQAEKPAEGEEQN